MTPVAALVAALALCAPASAADGDLDPSFGGDGMVEVAPFAEGARTALQADGKILAAGNRPDAFVARVLPGGEPDTGFGEGGQVPLDAPDFVTAIEAQPDGRIVILGGNRGGTSEDPTVDLAVVRLLGDGTPDPSFSDDGHVQIDLDVVSSFPSALLVQPDGRIVVAWNTDNSFDENDFFVARLETDGSLDESFSGDGLVAEDLGGDYEAVHSLALYGSRIVLAGATNLERIFSSASSHFAALRLHANGTRDASFDEDGVATAQVGTTSHAQDVIATDDGGLLLSGYSGASPFDWAFLKLDGAGEPDAGFGTGGELVLDIGAHDSIVWSAVNAGGDDVVVAGTHGGEAGLAKLSASGALVPGFGDGGSRFYGGGGLPRDLLRQSDGKLVFANSGFAMRLARVLDDTPVPQPPPPAPPPPILNVSGGSAVEGQILRFTATLSRPTDQPVSFDYITGEGHAATDRDFAGRRGTLTIRPGQTQVTIAIPTNPDRFFEADEDFRVELSNPQGARFGEYVAFGTILNDLRSGRCANVVVGRRGTDIITGSAAGDRIVGRQDQDFLFGLDGRDCIYGERGHDIIDAGDGDDVVDGGAGDDRIKGGAGDDRIYGRRGRNRYNGGAGNDRIYARNGVAEIVECGPGRDRVKADSRDRLRRCERVSR